MLPESHSLWIGCVRETHDLGVLDLFIDAESGVVIPVALEAHFLFFGSLWQTSIIVVNLGIIRPECVAFFVALKDLPIRLQLANELLLRLIEHLL